MGRTLVSFWGPAYFQGQTVSFRECMSLARPIHTVHFSGNLPIIITTSFSGISFRLNFHRKPAVPDLPKKNGTKNTKMLLLRGEKSFETQSEDCDFAHQCYDLLWAARSACRVTWFLAEVGGTHLQLTKNAETW